MNDDETQVFEVKADGCGNLYWHCKKLGWVPFSRFELSATAFNEGDKIELAIKRKRKRQRNRKTETR